MYVNRFVFSSMKYGTHRDYVIFAHKHTRTHTLFALFLKDRINYTGDVTKFQYVSERANMWEKNILNRIVMQANCVCVFWRRSPGEHSCTVYTGQQAKLLKLMSSSAAFTPILSPPLSALRWKCKLSRFTPHTFFFGISQFLSEFFFLFNVFIHTQRIQCELYFGH